MKMPLENKRNEEKTSPSTERGGITLDPRYATPNNNARRLRQSSELTDSSQLINDGSNTPTPPQSGSGRNNHIPQNVVLHQSDNSTSTMGGYGLSMRRNCASHGDLVSLAKHNADHTTYPKQLVSSVRRYSIGGSSSADNRGGTAANSTESFGENGLRRSLAEMKNSSIGQPIAFRAERFIDESDGGVRELICEVRPPKECEPMSKRNKWKKMFNKAIRTSEDGSCVGEEDISEDVPKQYTIASIHTKKSTTFDRCMHYLYLDRIASAVGSQEDFLMLFLEWSFHTSFKKLFLSQLAVFMTMIIIFAGFITLAGKLQPACIQGGDYDNTPFTDAFALSWTTFSTVGYGATYPSLGPQYTMEGYNSGQCAFIDILTSTEAFVGVLYAGFCGAIIFGKVLRLQSRAQVQFSDVIVVRYGAGVNGHDEDGEEADEVEEDDLDDSDLRSEVSTPSISICRHARNPCPVLEFRVINKNCGKPEGEIIDANLNVLAAFEDHKNTQLSMRGKKVLNSNFVPKIMFRQLNIEVKEHPFFQRVWYAKHVLDASSPLVAPEVRKRIKKNGGFWPIDLNNAPGVRRSIRFDQLLVNLSGISNLSTASVYAQKKYCDIDIVIGYQFVRMMYRDDKGVIKIDSDLITDVQEQFGGGGEPLEEGTCL